MKNSPNPPPLKIQKSLTRGDLETIQVKVFFGGGPPRKNSIQKFPKIDFNEHAHTFLSMLYAFQARIKDVISALKYLERCIETRREIKQKLQNFVANIGCQLEKLHFQQILSIFA